MCQCPTAVEIAFFFLSQHFLPVQWQLCLCHTCGVSGQCHRSTCKHLLLISSIVLVVVMQMFSAVFLSCSDLRPPEAQEELKRSAGKTTAFLALMHQAVSLFCLLQFVLMPDLYRYLDQMCNTSSNNRDGKASPSLSLVLITLRTLMSFCPKHVYKNICDFGGYWEPKAYWVCQWEYVFFYNNRWAYWNKSFVLLLFNSFQCPAADSAFVYWCQNTISVRSSAFCSCSRCACACSEVVFPVCLAHACNCICLLLPAALHLTPWTKTCSD